MASTEGPASCPASPKASGSRTNPIESSGFSRCFPRLPADGAADKTPGSAAGPRRSTRGRVAGQHVSVAARPCLAWTPRGTLRRPCPRTRPPRAAGSPLEIGRICRRGRPLEAARDQRQRIHVAGPMRGDTSRPEGFARRVGKSDPPRRLGDGACGRLGRTSRPGLGGATSVSGSDCVPGRSKGEAFRFPGSEGRCRVPECPWSTHPRGGAPRWPGPRRTRPTRPLGQGVRASSPGRRPK